MGLFARLHRITVGRVEAFLARAEDPEIIFPQLVREMEDQLRLATDAEAKAAAAVKAAQRDLRTAAESGQRMHRGAALALQQGDEATARKALAAQIDAERSAAQAHDAVGGAEATRLQAEGARQQIQRQLEELRSKRNEILTRSRVAQTRQKIQRTVGGSAGTTDTILDAVARLEAGVEEVEAELEIQSRLTGGPATGPSLEARLSELEGQAQIESRLAELRRSVEGEGDSAPAVAEAASETQ